jgi:hypothetical protein
MVAGFARIQGVGGPLAEFLRIQLHCEDHRLRPSREYGHRQSVPRQCGQQMGPPSPIGRIPSIFSRKIGEHSLRRPRRSTILPTIGLRISSDAVADLYNGSSSSAQHPLTSSLAQCRRHVRHSWRDGHGCPSYIRTRMSILHTDTDVHPTYGRGCPSYILPRQTQ